MGIVKSLVITSISKSSTPILESIFEKANNSGVVSFLILDKKSGQINSSVARVIDCDLQLELSFELSTKLPWNSYSRKNLGYLLAIQQGSEWLIETDDDNLPSQEFFNLENEIHKDVRAIKDKGWVNFYPLFGNDQVWPRGLPLKEVNRVRKIPSIRTIGLRKNQAPIFQVIANEDPDVDAIFRLTHKLPQYFNSASPVYIGPGSISPFNSQATWWHQSVALLSYFPSFISWRVADIWRSLIAQRILHTRNQGVLFFEAFVRQDRNSHDLMKDFEEELLCYTHSGVVWEILQKIPQELLEKQLSEAILTCYVGLVEAKLIPIEEIELLTSWIRDFESITSRDAKKN